MPSFTAFDWLPISLLGDGQRIDGRFDGRAAVASSAPNGNSVKNPVNQTAERQLGDDWNREVVGAIDCEGDRVIDWTNGRPSTEFCRLSWLLMDDQTVVDWFSQIISSFVSDEIVWELVLMLQSSFLNLRHSSWWHRVLFSIGGYCWRSLPMLPSGPNWGARWLIFLRSSRRLPSFTDPTRFPRTLDGLDLEIGVWRTEPRMGARFFTIEWLTETVAKETGCWSFGSRTLWRISPNFHDIYLGTGGFLDFFFKICVSEKALFGVLEIDFILGRNVFLIDSNFCVFFSNRSGMRLWIGRRSADTFRKRKQQNGRCGNPAPSPPPLRPVTTGLPKNHL